MKKSKLGIVVLLLALAGLAVARMTGLLGGGTIRLGAALPLTGKNAAVGAGMRNAMQLAIDQANRRGGIKGRRVELVTVDEGSDDLQKTRAAATQLGADERILGA